MISDVVIAGAGIGGLTLAVALKRRGVRVTHIEREAEVRPAGAGLVLSPNAVVALKQLGLAEATLEVGAVINRSAIRDAAGRPLGAEIDVALLSRDLGAPIVALHRAKLHEVLLHAVGRDTVHLGVAISRYEQDTDGVAVLCSNGARMETSLLVGADGLRSTVRAQLVGDGEPAYAGYTSWRGVTPTGAVPRPIRMSESWGHGERFGIVDIGFGQIYWFAVANAPPGGSDGDVRRELLLRFGGWHEPVRAIIEATPAAQILRTDISDRRPIHRWHDGRVALLGDAAHPMTPNLGQGAGQAIEDAVALDRCLADTDDLDLALRRFEVLRCDRANRMVRGSRALGALGQLQNPVAVWLRNTVMRLTPASVALGQARRMMRNSAA